jgi:hypothetical protein
MQNKLLLFVGISMELWAPQSQHTPGGKKNSNYSSETVELSVNVVRRTATS